MKGIKLIILVFVFFALAPMSLVAQPFGNSPSDRVAIPEVIWAASTGGGTWMSNVQVLIRDSGGTDVHFSFEYDSGIRGPFTIWTAVPQFNCKKLYNVLQYIQTYFDSGFDYFNKVGALSISTDNNRKIYASARTYNGAHSKTIQGLNREEAANTASLDRELVIQNLTHNSTYRSTVALWNETGYSVTVEFLLKNTFNNTIGTSWTETISSRRYMAFNPFTKAGVSGAYYDNCWLWINPTSGLGTVMVIGATAHNTSNDPSSHSAVQY